MFTTIPEVARRLRISRKTLHQAVRTRGMGVRYGGGPQRKRLALSEAEVARLSREIRIRKVDPGYGTFAMRLLAEVRRERRTRKARP